MTKPMTKAEIMEEIKAYKKVHCVPVSKMKKDELIRYADSLKIRTSKADPKVYKQFGMEIPENMRAKITPLTKKDLLRYIMRINGRDAKYYKGFRKKDLKDLYDSIKK